MIVYDEAVSFPVPIPSWVDRAIAHAKTLPMLRCRLCDELRRRDEINVDGTIHHGVRRWECLDRKVCGRAARKAKK